MEETKPRNLGGSLPVPNVQDLAAQPDEVTLTPTLLRRYVRPQPNTVDLRHDAPSGEEQEHVPVVDLGRLLDPDDLSGGRDEEAARLRSACEDWGFFQVVNHGIPEETLEEMKRNVMGFFALPLAEKAALAQQPGEIEGYGQAFVVSEEQTLDWADMFFLLTQPPSYRDLLLWPSNPSTFNGGAEGGRRASGSHGGKPGSDRPLEHDEARRVAGSEDELLPALPGGGRGQGAGPVAALGCRRADAAAAGQRGPGAADQEEWRLAPGPLPGALVVNVGDVIEVFTNGKYKSVEHRAVINTREERMSMATFHNGKFGTMYGPLKEVVGDEEARYRSVSVEEYTKLVFSSKLDGKNIMDAMKIN